MIEHASRRIRILGATPHPTAPWVTQTAKNLVMDLEDACSQVRFLIRDRDGKFPALFDAILADAAIEVVLSGVRVPRMNAIMQRWVEICRRELLDRTLVRNHQHLLHALKEFETFYNEHRPHQGIADARTLHPLPAPITDPSRSPTSTYEDATDSAAPSTSTNMHMTSTDEVLGKDRAEGSPDSLRSQGPASLPRLSEKQFAQLEAELAKGPAAHGWEDQRWTLSRSRL